MEVVVLVLFLVAGALILLRGSKAKETERKRVEEFASGLLARFSDADLVAEVERRRQVDPVGFARQIETGEKNGESVAEALAAELERQRQSGFSSGYAAGDPIIS